MQTQTTAMLRRLSRPVIRPSFFYLMGAHVGALLVLVALEAAVLVFE